MPDGGLYAIPLSIQGFVVYYNKKLYADAGLDPEKPPLTWAELTKVCDAIKAKGAVPCFALGNKEGFGIEFWFSAIAANDWTAEEQADFAAGKLKWSSPQVKAVLQSWVDANAAGWFPQGANSTAKFMDEYESFMRGEAANTIGLISDVAHWKQFDEFLGAENDGVFRMPAPTVAADQKEGDPKVPISGGIGYGVNKASPNVELAIEFAKVLASPEPMQIFFNDAGAIAANTKVDTAGITSPAAKAILGWLASIAARRWRTPMRRRRSSKRSIARASSCSMARRPSMRPWRAWTRCRPRRANSVRTTGRGRGSRARPPGCNVRGGDLGKLERATRRLSVRAAGDRCWSRCSASSRWSGASCCRSPTPAVSTRAIHRPRQLPGDRRRPDLPRQHREHADPDRHACRPGSCCRCCWPS